MKIVFIVGASRSGTTMLNRVLGNHSQITALNELHYFGDLWNPELGYSILPSNELKNIASTLIKRYRNGIWHKNISAKDELLAEEIVTNLEKHQLNGIDLFSTVADWIAHDNDCSIISEQTPRNIFYAQQLLDYYKDSCIIHMIRDPRAVLSSQKSRWKRKWLGGKNTPWTEVIRVWVNYHPITMSKLWQKSMRAGLTLARNPRYLAVKFEDIAKDPQSETRRICNFLDIQYQPGMIDVPQVGSSIKSNIESKKGISSDTLETWKSSLNQGEIAICEHINKPHMKEYNYTITTENIPYLSFLFYLLSFPLHLTGILLSNPRRAWIQLRAYLTK